MTNNARSHTLKVLGNPAHNIKDISTTVTYFSYSFKEEMVKAEYRCYIRTAVHPPVYSLLSPPSPPQLVAVNDNVLIHPSSLVISR